MSRATKVKHVYREVLEEFALPEPPQSIVKVLGGRGNNLHEVVDEHGEMFLASMPTKFRRNVWVKRGDFVIVEPIAEGDKVKAEIIIILYKEQIKFIKEEGKWPEGFLEKPVDGGGDDDNDLFVNCNRVQVSYEESDEKTSDEDDDEDNNEDESSDEDVSNGFEKNSVCSDEE
ncbi:probable RNA-binding protein EIF1AD [Varroa jacobsoni]|uniref:Probable RNA-binding protein EIF1AD n=1 Tax=Varroa destructor TaxID=109461 RepID=A0A7M7JW72_VARDE|nr:probable RNA-binding protein EIF1AD [Varroa destructor]XP_022697972.1 probable RNA-binding protein EIF1AD [Varroa jacobsoni]